MYKSTGPIALLRSSQLVCARIRHHQHNRRLHGYWPHHQFLGRPKIFYQYSYTVVGIGVSFSYKNTGQDFSHVPLIITVPLRIQLECQFSQQTKESCQIAACLLFQAPGTKPPSVPNTRRPVRGATSYEDLFLFKSSNCKFLMQF